MFQHMLEGLLSSRYAVAPIFLLSFFYLLRDILVDKIDLLLSEGDLRAWKILVPVFWASH